MSIFARDWTGDRFHLFGPAHLVALLLVACAIALVAWRFRGASDIVKRRGALTIVALLWGQEIAYHAWRLSIGTWTPKEMLPFHLCSVMVWFGGFLLLTRKQWLYDFLYLLGIAGALQALLTPDIGQYGPPHARFFQFFISHGLIVLTAVWATAVEGMRPTWSSVWRVAIGANLYAVAVFFINLAVGSNYLFINRKPSSKSVLDALPAWPGYLPFIEAIGWVFVLLFFVPWVIRDAVVRRRTTQGVNTGSPAQ